MPRYFEPINSPKPQEWLWGKIQEAWKKHSQYDDNEAIERYCLKDLTPQIAKDLKVEFDFENCNQDKHKDYKSGKAISVKIEKDNKFLGGQTLDNGFTFWGFSAGGDWEWPVFFLFYFYGKKLRAYIPTEGNRYNTDTMKAYGNDSDADSYNMYKLYYNPQNGFSDDPDDLWDEPPDWDVDEMIQDIKNRIVLKF